MKIKLPAGDTWAGTTLCRTSTNAAKPYYEPMFIACGAHSEHGQPMKYVVVSMLDGMCVAHGTHEQLETWMGAQDDLIIIPKVMFRAHINADGMPENRTGMPMVAVAYGGAA